MHVTYAFVYYFCIVMLMLTVSLTIFFIKPLRKQVFNYMKKVKLMDHFVIQSIVYISFIVIFVILADSIWTYYSIRQNLEAGATNLRDFALDNFEMIKAGQKQDYLQLYKNYRQYYMAERNFMLTSSALFISFVFHRLCAAIQKFNDLENDISNGTLKSVDKVQKIEQKQNSKKQKSA